MLSEFVSSEYAFFYLAYSLLSGFSFCLYGFDKLAAKQGWRRIRESTLHWFSFFGGWPGALLAQKLFRHKTSKKPFQLTFWLVVIVNVLLFIAIIFYDMSARK